MLCRRNLLQLYSISEWQSAIGDMSNILSTPTELRSMPEDVANVGERSLLKLCEVIRATSLDELCVTMYTRSISRSSLDSVIRVRTSVIITTCCRCQVSFLSCLSCTATMDGGPFYLRLTGICRGGRRL